MEVQGSADEIVPNMLALLREQLAVAGDTLTAGEDATPQGPTTGEATLAAEDRDL